MVLKLMVALAVIAASAEAQAQEARPFKYVPAPVQQLAPAPRADSQANRAYDMEVVRRLQQSFRTFRPRADGNAIVNFSITGAGAV